MMNKLDEPNGTCLDIVPCHAVDTTSGRVGKLVERTRREVEIVVCASYAAIHYSACYAFALVYGSMYEHCRQTTWTGDHLQCAVNFFPQIGF